MYRKGDLVYCKKSIPTSPVLQPAVNKYMISIPKEKMVYTVKEIIVIMDQIFISFNENSVSFPEEFFADFQELSEAEKNEYILYNFQPN